MARYSVVKLLPDDDTPVVSQIENVPVSAEIGDEIFIDSIRSLLIWTGSTWQVLTDPIP